MDVRIMRNVNGKQTLLSWNHRGDRRSFIDPPMPVSQVGECAALLCDAAGLDNQERLNDQEIAELRRFFSDYFQDEHELIAYRAL